ncbi:MAG TPA: hypothetical protein VLC11_05620 [Gemmatimonadales bacterium]|nr:hypothetical protein [Gemmatimonadales bacterium]HSC59022.1 hypothetical protein [Gemmatimonadales bacterium]
MTLKGRHWVMLWLVVFLAVAGVVVARTAAGYRAAGRLQEAREERASLEARRGELEREIRQASSRQVLVPRVESALGLHLPSDSDFVLFQPAPAGSGTR